MTDQAGNPIFNSSAMVQADVLQPYEPGCPGEVI
jgi:hypothetical protein